MKKRITMGVAVVAVVGIAILSFFLLKPRDVFQKFNLDPSNVSALIEQLENESFPNSLSASITDQQVLIYYQNETYEIDIHDSLLYVSFAPYLTYTHDCFRHSLTGCQGEMVNQNMVVKIYDDSLQLLDTKTVNTGKDGFIGLFLERNRTYKIVVEYENMQTEFFVMSGTTQTCYSELKLQ